MHLAVALVAHLAAFWGVVLLADLLPAHMTGLLSCHASGATVHVAGQGWPRLQFSVAQFAWLTFYAPLLAAIFWGANGALEVLGDSVRASRLPPEQRVGLPLHLLIFPGSTSVSVDAWSAP